MGRVLFVEDGNVKNLLETKDTDFRVMVSSDYVGLVTADLQLTGSHTFTGFAQTTCAAKSAP